MKITIGGEDFSSALDAAHALTIERRLNEPSVCQLWISLPTGSQAAITRNQPLHITGDDGVIYFTGYIAAAAMPEFAGIGMGGPRYRLALQALSDECLLDQVKMASPRSMARMNAGPLVASLATNNGSSALSTQSLTVDTPISNFRAAAGTSFSSNAAAASSQARATYRALDGSLTLSSIPAAVHQLSENNGSLKLANLTLKASTRRALANDITVCGEHEPTAYVTEFFRGDGVTNQFDLSSRAFVPASSRTMIIRELFDEPQIDLGIWGNPGSHDYLSLGANGLEMEGGTGRDGDTKLSSNNLVEMGGTLLLEAIGVTLANGSTGIVGGLYSGELTKQGCTAGFQVTASQGSGAVSIQPIVLGLAAGSSYTVSAANQYNLRVRVHCPEHERGLAVYHGYGDSGEVACGGQWNTAPAKLQFEIQECVNGVAGMPVILYDGQIGSLPGACSVVAASSIHLFGSIRAIHLRNLGSGWVVTTPADGSSSTRRIGTAAEAAECWIDSAGRLMFFTGFTPQAGEQIAVSYRAVGRAAGRTVNTASQQMLAQEGLPSVSTWIGSVTNPAPRSSQDCRNAALALEQAGVSAGGALSGTYACVQLDLDTDVWPGDALALNIPSANLNVQVVIRCVKVTYQSSYPDLISYEISFANDWAEDLAIHTSTTVPEDVWFPVPVSPMYLPNLNALSVTSMSGGNVSLNTGAMAPAGGGFEIRRRDNSFMPGIDPDLVMRGAQPNLTFTRVSASDRYFVRMYDASTPPNYSEFSAALISICRSRLNRQDGGEQQMRMMSEFEAQVLSDLCVLKAQMSGLMGDGNGGRIADLEHRMELHEQNWQRAKGFMAAFSVVLAVAEVAAAAWHRHQ